jgi:hypothetical protein
MINATQLVMHRGFFEVFNSGRPGKAQKLDQTPASPDILVTFGAMLDRGSSVIGQGNARIWFSPEVRGSAHSSPAAATFSGRLQRRLPERPMRCCLDCFLMPRAVERDGISDCFPGRHRQSDKKGPVRNLPKWHLKAWVSVAQCPLTHREERGLLPGREQRGEPRCW